MKNTKPVDKSEKLALENELKTDKYGAKVERIEIGPSGKQLNLDDFKFDDNFGGKFHQTPVYEDRREPFGADGLARLGTSSAPQNTFSSEQVNYFDSSSFKQQTAEPEKPTAQPSKMGEKGFLDFENIFSASGKGYNPFN